MTNIIDFINQSETMLKDKFISIADTALHNAKKVLDAFKANKVSSHHFNFTTGYGYDDIGKSTLNRVVADIFKTQDAIVSPNIASGTHAISIALYGLLMPNDELISISGKPYDTLNKVICGDNIGSLKDYNISYKQVDLINNRFDKEGIKNAITPSSKVIFIGRSRGYDLRDALMIEDIEEICTFIKGINPDITILVDNCYGEFVHKKEPCEVGADIAVGSLIKNIGGGLAVSGGYIVGSYKNIEKISYRLTCPSIGNEVGSYYAGYLNIYQGLFLAPTMVKNALMGSALISSVYSRLGYSVIPEPLAIQGDIITSIILNDKEKLLEFIRQVQYNSPVDSYVTPEPWAMPGYDCEVSMAAGTFIQGASLELSCDSPIKPPYVAYIQGGLTYEHIKIALINCLSSEFKS